MAMELNGKISFDEREHAYLYDAVILHNTDRALWRNFSGGPTRFNKVGGKRFFTVLLFLRSRQESLLQEGGRFRHISRRTKTVILILQRSRLLDSKLRLI